MLRYALTLLLVHVVRTQNPEGNICNYTIRGDEVFNNAAPLSTFSTSGDDFIRKQWCLTYCKDRKSAKVEMLYQPTLGSSGEKEALFTVKHERSSSGELKSTITQTAGTPYTGKFDDDDFCYDDTVAATVDAVVDKFNDPETMAEALNYYINKPGWAYIVYQFGPAPSFSVTENAKMDNNFCLKNSIKQFPNNTFLEFQVISGLIQTN